MDNDAYLALWGAALQVAIDDVIAAMRSERWDQDRRMSHAWIFTNSRETRSFLWVCDICGVDPRRVRDVCRA